jgi:hypothetical protein
MNTEPPADPIDACEKLIRAQSGVEGLRAVAQFLHALPSSAILSWDDDVWTPAAVLAMELEARANAP